MKKCNLNARIVDYMPQRYDVVSDYSFSPFSALYRCQDSKAVQVCKADRHDDT